MNIKEEIGQRIYNARKEKNLTRKALAESTDDLKPSRINNWERGIRTPGPEEIKQLSKALDVSPAFLMCLTNQKQSLGKTAIPLIDLTQAGLPTLKDQILQTVTAHIPVHNEWGAELGAYAFALIMPDDSMEPELRASDILIVDPDKQPKPGDFVVAQLQGEAEVIIRRYKQLSPLKNKQPFELLSINAHWADIKDCEACCLIGTVCGFKRMF